MKTVCAGTFALLVAALLAVAPAAAEVYGAGATLEKAVAVSELLGNAEAYRDKTVMVKGLVVNVCAARGCWLEVAGDEPFQSIRVKVEDGTIVFPMTARGRQATVQGVFEVMQLCPDEAARYRQHQARLGGEAFDASAPGEPLSVYSIRATGAVID